MRVCFSQIERLRKEGNRILEEAQEQLKEDLKKKTDLNRVYIDSDSDDEEELTAKLKVNIKSLMRQSQQKLSAFLVC